MNRFHQAEVKCASVGKRLCTESEWTFACEGPEMMPFPYGYVRDANKCNGDHPWDEPEHEEGRQARPRRARAALEGRAERIAARRASATSASPTCRATRTRSSRASSSPATAPSSTACTPAGPWYKGVRNQCRPKIYTHDEDFYYYFLSFRCCAEPDGKPTDPAHAAADQGGLDDERVEKSARFTIGQMKREARAEEGGQVHLRGARHPLQDDVRHAARPRRRRRTLIRAGWPPARRARCARPWRARRGRRCARA